MLQTIREIGSFRLKTNFIKLYSQVKLLQVTLGKGTVSSWKLIIQDINTDREMNLNQTKSVWVINLLHCFLDPLYFNKTRCVFGRLLCTRMYILLHWSKGLSPKKGMQPKLGMQQASLEFHQNWVYSQTVGLVANQDNVVWDLF